jgi:hypothetical protein
MSMPIASEDFTSLVRSDFRNRPLRDILNLPPQALLGVSADAELVLEKLEIKTVFDLATSAIFGNATKLVRAASDFNSALFQHGTPTADMVRQADVAGKKVGELQFLSIGVLEGIPTDDTANIEEVLDVVTVRDLALYPPFRAAERLLNAAYFPENAAGFDSEMPADLLPKSGEFPTERVQYTTLLMDEISIGPEDRFVDLQSNDFQPIEISRLSLADAGFKKVAMGALLTMNQSWFAQGVTLGQLLHSVALAPGESTRIAVIDWSRKSRASETEKIDETDDLTSDTYHNRAISEVTTAVANEAQTGFSSTNANATSKQSGSSSANDGGSFLGGVFGDSESSSGGSSSEGSGTSHSDSFSTSAGHRDIGSNMMQNVDDRTHQHASSSRSRRASVVKEVSQTEHEAVSTRVVANYNHMHALTVQYYEVVQVYRTEVAVVKADQVVFIPIALIDFDNDDTIRRFRDVLARRALNFNIRDALRNLDVIAIKPDATTHFSALNGNLGLFLKDIVVTPSRLPAAPVIAPLAEETPVAATTLQFSAKTPVSQRANALMWSSEQVSRISNLLGSVALRPQSNAIYLPTDVTLEAAMVTGSDKPLTIMFYRRQGGNTSTVSAEAPIAMTDISRIALEGSSDRDISATITLTVSRNGVRFPLELPAVKVAAKTTAETRVVTVEPGGVNVNLKQHLNANKLYYSQIVYRSLDSTQIALLLSGFALKSDNKLVPVSQLIEPTPIRYVGNYLAFKMNSDPKNDKSWYDFLKRRGIHLGATQENIVPLATGGTFAEAVLGRFNCAEKLDITRFWNWQDSPTPLQPTEIGAIQTGSRATNEDVKPGQLSNPIINITSPTSLPDPSGTSAILTAIQNGNMFRDMSGLSATIGLAQAALQASSAGAATAGQQAGTNMNNLLQAAAEKQRVAADLVASVAKTAASLYTGGAAGGGISSGGGNHSQDGAKINYFDKTQGQTGAGGGSTGGGAVTPQGGGGQSGGGTTAAGGGTGGSGSNGTGNGFSQNPAALAATWGDGEPRSGLFQQVIDKIPNGETGDTTPTGSGTEKTDPYVFISGLSTSGTSLVVSKPLGVNPGGQFNNAVDIQAKNLISGLQDPTLEDHPQPIRHTQFRWRQTASQTGFQKIGTNWKQIFHTVGSEPDDPEPNLQNYDAASGWLRMFDSPGWPTAVGPSTRTLDLGKGFKSDMQSTQVVWKMFLQTWVEGLNAASAWERVSSNVLEWCSVQWLKRSTPNSDWQTTPNAKIVSGNNAMQEFAKSPEDIDI